MMLSLENGDIIQTAQVDGITKYLGELVFIAEMVKKLNSNLIKLVSSFLLKPEQVNQYLFPGLTYSQEY